MFQVEATSAAAA